jgi:O-antigen/teichoic acid export membrane protein
LRVRKSLTVNAMSLMAATIAANGLGLAFWAEAAHVESTNVVGQASADIAALSLLTVIAQLNLTNVFIRLLPVAGRLSGILLKRGYLAVLGLSCVAGAVYVGTGLSSHLLTGGLESRVLFALAVPVLSIFALEDSVLTAFRLAPWVAAENISVALARLALLPVLAVPWLSGGTVASWVLPATVAVVVVNLLVFRRALPVHARDEGTLPSRRLLVSLVSAEYAGNIFIIGSSQVMPLLVVWKLGVTQAAYLAIPWLIAPGIYLVMWNVSSSFVVEALRTRGPVTPLLRRTVLLLGAIASAAAVVCAVGARPLLEIVGARYAMHSVELLQLVGVSAPFSAVVVLSCTLAWLEQRVWLLAGFQAVSGVTVLSFALILLPRIGLDAVGWAYLMTQIVSALVATPYLVRWIRANRVPRVQT